MLKILRYLQKKEWGLALLAFVFIILSVWMEMTMPEYMAEITRLVQTPGSKMSEILTAGGKMLLFALGSLAATAATSVCAAKMSTSLGASLRGKMFHKVQSFSMEEIGRFSTASLLTRTTNDVVQVQMLIVMGACRCFCGRPLPPYGQFSKSWARAGNGRSPRPWLLQCF